jgi:drug/metabolite transporter (DMT)-like permease
MDLRNAVMLLLFAVLCAGSLFMESTDFVNRQVAPKWYWTVLCTVMLALLIIITSLFTRRQQFNRSFTSIAFVIIGVLCTFQAIMQWIIDERQTNRPHKDNVLEILSLETVLPP